MQFPVPGPFVARRIIGNSTKSIVVGSLEMKRPLCIAKNDIADMITEALNIQWGERLRIVIGVDSQMPTKGWANCFGWFVKWDANELPSFAVEDIRTKEDLPNQWSTPCMCKQCGIIHETGWHKADDNDYSFCMNCVKEIN